MEKIDSELERQVKILKEACENIVNYKSDETSHIVKCYMEMLEIARKALDEL